MWAEHLLFWAYIVSSEQHLIAVLDADVEAAAHFDHWQRAHLDDQNVRQDLWPEALRNARVMPAVEYIQVWLKCFLCCHVAVVSRLGQLGCKKALGACVRRGGGQCGGRRHSSAITVAVEVLCSEGQLCAEPCHV